MHDAHMPQIRPATPEAVVAAVVALLSDRPGRVRLAVDGAPAADPRAWASRICTALAPRPVLHVVADRFWRPASLRLEHGRSDPDAWLDGYLDTQALRREVLDPFAARGRALPALRDPVTDRSMRLPPVTLPPNGILVVSGSVLLGRGLPFDVAIHLRLSPAALSRRTSPGEAWTLAALARYEAERHPESHADLVVRADDPRHPALVEWP
jgi:hypothetical protein